jgi:hypothetical protein
MMAWSIFSWWGLGSSARGGAGLDVCHAPFRKSGHGTYICTSSTFATNALNEVRVVGTGFAAALPLGAAIQNGQRFGGKDKPVGMGFVAFRTSNTHSTKWYGPWMNGGNGVRNRYLGLKFEIGGQFHFGWARLTVTTTQPHTWRATLTGFAYETVSGKGIFAGQMKGADDASAEESNPALTVPTPESATLGVLALGSPGLSIWRREERAVAAQVKRPGAVWPTFRESTASGNPIIVGVTSR